MNLTFPISVACLLLPCFLLSIFYSFLKGRCYEMDWGAASGTFLVTYALHRKFFWVIFSLSLIGMVLFTHTPYPPIAIFFLFAGIYSFLFQGFVALFYEHYLHRRYPRTLMGKSEQDKLMLFYSCRSNYTGFRYALTLALASSSLLLFILGLLLSVPAMLER